MPSSKGEQKEVCLNIANKLNWLPGIPSLHRLQNESESKGK